jgi:hypothetical protein
MFFQSRVAPFSDCCADRTRNLAHLSYCAHGRGLYSVDGRLLLFVPDFAASCLAFVMPRTRKKKGIFSPTISAQQQGVFISGR